MKDGAIGVFDSGIGGLTVMKELLRLLPGESFVYFGDTARVPYGNKSAETVLKFSREAIYFLMQKGVKLVVVACNTASAEALPALEKEMTIPVVGVIEPGIRAAVTATKKARVGVIGTLGTIRSGAYQNGIKQLAPDVEVFARACPLFVPLAEEGWVDGEVAGLVATRYLSEYRQEGIDTLVLGCTHYPLLHGVIGRVMGNDVTLVDSAVETAKRVAEVLSEKQLHREEEEGNFSVYLSDISPTFKQVGERFLGREIPVIHLRNG
ncbi:MAG: glutamate racemase [Candidatus Latescibacteria bacterium]|nr:glutamate racemase [Candidatus Latescibacterota bacterium]NIM64500.1 glutamate racemase [Candidatus Latescibacterota bacterium]NIO00653.1 glutamate racemase [Candidatus Latescibacterota bacterium]NIO27056.1 glutamate racemase [Candidatus Latescibacterota bacterium]NIO54580.1 glutamate racemase [Candidatus Latescibacterota bacterium]